MSEEANKPLGEDAIMAALEQKKEDRAFLERIVAKAQKLMGDQ